MLYFNPIAQHLDLLLYYVTEENILFAALVFKAALCDLLSDFGVACQYIQHLNTLVIFLSGS